MGAPLPPHAIMPDHWAKSATLKELPGDTAMEPDLAYWIDELNAWIAADEEEAEMIREAIGADGNIFLGGDLSSQ